MIAKAWNSESQKSYVLLICPTYIYIYIWRCIYIYIYTYIYIIYIWRCQWSFFFRNAKTNVRSFNFLFFSTHYDQKYLYGYSNISYHKKLGLRVPELLMETIDWNILSEISSQGIVFFWAISIYAQTWYKCRHLIKIILNVSGTHPAVV